MLDYISITIYRRRKSGGKHSIAERRAKDMADRYWTIETYCLYIYNTIIQLLIAFLQIYGFAQSEV